MSHVVTRSWATCRKPPHSLTLVSISLLKLDFIEPSDYTHIRLLPAQRTPHYLQSRERLSVMKKMIHATLVSMAVLRLRPLTSAAIMGVVLNATYKT